MTPLPLAAVIPAAGSSSRMGHFKPLLRVNGQTLIQRALSVFRQNRIDDFIAVTEHRRPLCDCRLVDSIGRSQASGCHGSVV
ncbi:MAG: NTP transferase domain-containing protein [Desulfobacterales bacterium]